MERFMESVGKDRRLAQRHEMKMPLRLRLKRSEASEMKVESENVSRRGVFFKTAAHLKKGTAVDLLLEMPEEITGVRAAHWICMGHVVRIEPGITMNGTRGVGVEFDFYVVSHTATPRWELAPGLRGPMRP